MLIKQIKIAGFRGFNTERTIDFHDRLTVISAQNSHGKTSISEALEFLIYGTTSKVQKADSKEEYKDSYRNRHFPAGQSAYIEAMVSDGENHRLRVELDPDGTTIRRFRDGVSVDRWPFEADSQKAARPFVLQHALKYLLLVPPAERFQGFAQLLGLNEVDGMFQAILALCTKPTASIPEEGQRALNNLSALEERLKTIPELKKVITAFGQGMTRNKDAYRVIETRANALLAKKFAPEDQLRHLIEARDAATAKIYSGSIAIPPLTEMQSSQLFSTRNALSTMLAANFLDDYGRLCVHLAEAKLQKEASLLKLGIELLKESPDVCPLCTQSLDDELRDNIHRRHGAIRSEIEKQTEVEQSRSRTNRAIEDARENLKRNKEIYESRTSGLISSMQPENEPRVIELLGGPDAASVAIIRAAAGTSCSLRERLRNAAVQVDSALKTCESAIDCHTENLADVENLGKALQDYLATADEFSAKISEFESNLAGPAKLFRQAIDALAGTTEISAIIDLLDQRTTIERALHVKDILNGLKELKKYAEQTLAETMEVAMNTDLTAAVMKWYSKIKTAGDPDVHFSGFAMDRTKSGDFKSRRLSVKAKSYGVELASAVSSLSESKLNALGLCVSIASAIRKPGPWSFLIIDDPIQSWDDEHETQFIDVIRSLVETEGKQVVVLSHKGSWANEVCAGCRTLNGIHYQITGYTKDGPHIVALNWSPLEERLREAEAITNDPKATPVRLQQAEEELRHAACQLASIIAKAKLNRTTSPHNMNKNDVRAIFVESGLEVRLVDRIQAMFVSADDAHHTPKTYQPNIQRIRQALACLRDVLKSTKTS